MLNVESSIPVPRVRMRREYPYKVMEVGDSFFVPDAKMQVVCNNNYRTGKLLGKKFIARRLGDGVRVWRTE